MNGGHEASFGLDPQQLQTSVTGVKMNEPHGLPATCIHQVFVALDRCFCSEHWEVNEQFHCLLPGMMVIPSHTLRSSEAIKWYL